MVEAQRTDDAWTSQNKKAVIEQLRQTYHDQGNDKREQHELSLK